MEQSYVALTTHPTKQSAEVKVNWGAQTPEERRPIIGVEQLKVPRNAIGAHGARTWYTKPSLWQTVRWTRLTNQIYTTHNRALTSHQTKAGMVRIRTKAFVPWIRGVTK